MATKTVVVGSSKGGTGKSTTSLQFSIGLAREGARVWHVDGDRQQTSVTAITLRAESGRPTIAASAYADGRTLRTQVLQQRDAYDYVVIDAGGRDSSALRAALTVCDAVAIPCLPRTFDVWAMQDMMQLVDEARAVRELTAYAFLNAADAGGADNRDAAAALAEFPQVELLPFRLGRRKAFANACGAGLHVEEMPRRDLIACAEIDRLTAAIFGL
ncbi:plasmid segregation oscillating ATPase ParF [Paraburkholderia eburnea]|uniref:Plasmid segregation oscillating ATPase ParF n=1 Tax=Paraburkholderia eburnea TaxID=1189126 RepID=A0A2S4LWB6_9BURK|nr:AAA family ATPase [Paraburkholderia eburnea]POR46727.1 plasmid segregation oscillating ATPase ParF [Paraburkholderia eburnea]PRZ17916.1 plasmid segregation oscillating ATPase ParF [Paraburkholderia eburnea]